MDHGHLVKEEPQAACYGSCQWFRWFLKGSGMVFISGSFQL